MKDELLGFLKTHAEPVEVEGFGEVYIGEMSGLERNCINDLSFTAEGKPHKKWRNCFRELVLATTLKNQDGSRLFENIEDGARELLKCAAPAIDALYEHASKINKLKAEDIEAAAKNLEADQSADSPSDSPEL